MALEKAVDCKLNEIWFIQARNIGTAVNQPIMLVQVEYDEGSIVGESQRYQGDEFKTLIGKPTILYYRKGDVDFIQKFTPKKCDNTGE